MKRSTAIILVHFGSPASTRIGNIYRFLVEIFDRLHGPTPSFFHKLLSRVVLAPLFVLPTRNKYMTAGFALRDCCQKLVHDLNAPTIFLAMQHGNPSIETVCQEVLEQHFEKIIVMPLYPQTVPGMTQSIYDRSNLIQRFFCEEFHLASWYIESLVETLKKQVNQYEAILFSYHSVLEKEGALYRQQCVETSMAVMNKIGKDIVWEVGFQSKMPFGQWLSKESGEILIDFARKGIKNVLVIAPGFITPCTETIIDIEKGLRTLFLKHGGTRLDLLPPLCTQDCCIQRLSAHIHNL